MQKKITLKRSLHRLWNRSVYVLRHLAETMLDNPHTTGAIILSAIIGIMLFVIPVVGPYLFLICEPFILIFLVVMLGSRDYSGRR